VLNLHFHPGAGSSTTQMPNCHCFDEKSVLVKEFFCLSHCLSWTYRSIYLVVLSISFLLMSCYYFLKFAVTYPNGLMLHFIHGWSFWMHFYWMFGRVLEAYSYLGKQFNFLFYWARGSMC
jgi:hypothetical protein